MIVSRMCLLHGVVKQKPVRLPRTEPIEGGHWSADPIGVA
jgi:hypothetical protein